MQTGAGDSGSRRRSEGGEEGRGTEGRGKGEERQGRETEGRETGKRDRGKREEGQRGETSSSFRTLCSAVLATECLCSVQSFLDMGRSATPVLKRPAGKACAPSRTSQRSLASRRRKRSKGHGSRSRSPSPKGSRGHGSQKSSLKPAATSGGACHKRGTLRLQKRGPVQGQAGRKQKGKKRPTYTPRPAEALHKVLNAGMNVSVPISVFYTQTAKQLLRSQGGNSGRNERPSKI